MKKRRFLWMCCAVVGLQSFASAAFVPLVISEWLANPPGTDSPFEYVELIATKTIDFSVTPHSVLFANNGTASANGWSAGGTLSYAFTINSGSVVAGDVVYVGGSSLAPGGNAAVTKLRTINTGTTAGDSLGAAATGGVLGNGGSNADAIAVFDVAASLITSTTVPVDAIFFGSGIGSAVAGAGTTGYELPVNDKYAGGKLQSTSFAGPDPGSGDVTIATGVYDPGTGLFTTARTFSNVAATAGSTTGNQNNGTAGVSGVTVVVVPEPASAAVWVGLMVMGMMRRR